MNTLCTTNTSDSQSVTAKRERVATPRADILATEQGYELILAVPGAGKDDVELTVERDRLSVSASVGNPQPAGAHPVRREFAVDRWQRSFVLDDEIDRDAISARLDNGLLTVTLVKTQEAAPKRIAIA